MGKLFRWIVGVVALMVLTGFFKFDVNKLFLETPYLVLFTKNILFVLEGVKTIFPIIILIAFFDLCALFRKRQFFVRKSNLGGANVVFARPEEYFKQQVKNCLNTKRSVFRINTERDNFYDVIKSYYSVYAIISEEIKIYDTKSSSDSRFYKLANKMIKELNDFLTNHQDNYRRWYDYMLNEKREQVYDKDISVIQKEYRHYIELVEDFQKVNQAFTDIAVHFGIDTEKWKNVHQAKGK